MLFISGSAIPAEQLDLGDDHVAVLPHRRHPMGLEPEPLPEARLHQHRPAPPLVMQNEQDTRGGLVPLAKRPTTDPAGTAKETSRRSSAPAAACSARSSVIWPSNDLGAFAH